MAETAVRSSLTDAEADAFLADGFLVLHGVLTGEEILRMREETRALVDRGAAGVAGGGDWMYAPGHRTGKPVLRRIEYVIDKTEAGKVLLGHPFILRSVERLQGRDFIPTWDAMVIKMPGEGIAVPWHRDAATEYAGEAPIFNVDFYLDEATPDNCLWVHPGSHRWDPARVAEVTGRPGFDTAGATPVPMQPGDVIFHNILLVHGSAASGAPALRRVVYYEFRPARVEAAAGPHTPEYIPLKQAVLLACLERRARCGYAAGETPFRYDPPPPFVPPVPAAAPPPFRCPHERYWRRA